MTARLVALGLACALGCLSLDARAAWLEDDPPPPKRVDGGYLGVRAGGTYRYLIDIPVYGVDVGLSFGRWGRRGADFFSLEYFVGRTRYGLRTDVWAFRYRTDWQLGRVYLGFSPGLGVMAVRRVTDGTGMASAGLLLSGYAGWDVLRTEATAMALELGLNADAYGVGFLGPSAAVALRF